MTKPSDSEQSFLRRIVRLVRESICRHSWRPAVLSVNRKPYMPVKVCKHCEKAVLISTPEFYARFGRMPW